VARVPEHCIVKLRERGLFVSPPFRSDHYGYPDGVVVGKPRGVGSNCVAGYRFCWGLEGTTLDAPTAYLHGDGIAWFVTVRIWIGGPGPGDFVRQFARPEEAADDIIDFYFGDPSRMNAFPPSFSAAQP
jgi:hypothetical protein